MLTHQRRKFRDDLGMSALGDDDLGALFQCRQAQFGQAWPLDAGERTGDTGKRLALPQAQGRIQRLDGTGRILPGPALLGA